MDGEYRYGPHGLPVRRPPTTPAQDAAAQNQRAFEQAVEHCIRARLLPRRFSLNARGHQILIPILNHLGWTAEDLAVPDGREQDMLDELLLLVYDHGHSLHTPTTFLTALFTLFSDMLALGRTRLGEKLLSHEGGQLLRQPVAGYDTSETVMLLLLAIKIRDRLVARGNLRGADMGYRLLHKKRAEIAARLGPR